MADTSTFNIGSPYSEVKKYVGQENKGFFVFPSDDSNTGGWGKPFTDPSGTPIDPGTPGGSETRRFLGRNSEGNWINRKTPGTQMYGNISWLGPRKSPTIDKKGKWVLTYHGPNTRYFPTDSFSYGSDSAHNDIYCEGICIAVAPFPVLGAALTIDPPPQPGEREVFFLKAICWNGSEDVVYGRPIEPFKGVNLSGYDSAFRSKAMDMYDPQNNPEGWRILGYMQCVNSSQGSSRTVKHPRTPWFFDSSGMQAQCMREADITFDRGDGNVTQQGYVRYKAVVTDVAVSLSCPDNTSGFTFTISAMSERRADYSAVTKYPHNAPAAPVVPHSWDVYHTTASVIGQGTYVIAVDYDGTTEELLKVELMSQIDLAQWLYRGIDDPATYIPNNYNNWGHAGGDLYIYDVDPTHVSAEEDGTSTVWMGLNDVYKLVGKGFDKMAWLYRRLSGSASEFATGTFDANDPYVYFHFYSRMYPHYYSLARPHISAYMEEEMQQKVQANVGDWDIFQKASEYYEQGTIGTPYLADKFMEKPYPTFTMTIDPTPGFGIGWSYYDVINIWGGGVQYTKTFYSIDGRYPTDHVFAEDEPDPEKFFANYVMDIASNWPTIPDTLQSIAKNYREGNHAEDSVDNFAVSMKYKDENNKDVYYNAINGSTGEMERLTGATDKTARFYKLGET